jgi:hypothetical protein
MKITSDNLLSNDPNTIPTDQSVKQAILQLQTLDPLAFVHCISVSNIVFNIIDFKKLTLNSTTTLTIDSYVILNGDSVILAGQTNSKDNGIYIVNYVSGKCEFTRRNDFDTETTMKANRVVSVKNGTLNGNTIWLSGNNVTVVGVDIMTFNKSSVVPTNLSMTVTTNTVNINSSTGVSTTIPIITNDGKPGLLSGADYIKLNNSLSKTNNLDDIENKQTALNILTNSAGVPNGKILVKQDNNVVFGDLNIPSTNLTGSVT